MGLIRDSQGHLHFRAEAAVGIPPGNRTRKRRPVSRARNRLDAEDAAKIIARITPWAGSSDLASAWYRSQPIPAFGNRTAEALVRAGRARLVHEYLDSIAVGGFA